ncbi:hypothetical protein [Planomonospora algeriensis]
MPHDRTEPITLNPPGTRIPFNAEPVFTTREVRIKMLAQETVLPWRDAVAIGEALVYAGRAVEAEPDHYLVDELAEVITGFGTADPAALARHLLASGYQAPVEIDPC